MKKSLVLKEIQKRLPDDLVIQDETSFDYSEDEYLGILCWLKYLREHYRLHGKDKQPEIVFPIISKRLRLDFGLYRFPCDVDSNKGKHVIYISENGKFLNGKIKIQIQSTKSLINNWHL